jgi:hypothetical protein
VPPPQALTSESRTRLLLDAAPNGGVERKRNWPAILARCGKPASEAHVRLGSPRLGSTLYGGRFFGGEAVLMMELPRRHAAATPFKGKPARTHEEIKPLVGCRELVRMICLKLERIQLSGSVERMSRLCQWLDSCQILLALAGAATCWYLPCQLFERKR